MLHIDVRWSQPLDLVVDPDDQLIYVVRQIENVPEVPGVYVFARCFGDNAIPLYVGETRDLRSRLNQHLRNNVKLMRGIQKARSGRRIFLFGEALLKKGQNTKKVLQVLQRALIERTLSEGHDELLNDKGAKTPVHTIRSAGNRCSEQVAGRFIYCR